MLFRQWFHDLRSVYTGPRSYLLWKAQALSGILLFAAGFAVANWARDLYSGRIDIWFSSMANASYFVLSLLSLWMLRRGRLSLVATVSVLAVNILQAAFSTEIAIRGLYPGGVFLGGAYFAYPFVFLGAIFGSPWFALLLGGLNIAWLQWAAHYFLMRVSADQMSLVSIGAQEATTALIFFTGLCAALSILIDRTTRHLEAELHANQTLRTSLEKQVESRTQELQEALARLKDANQVHKNFVSELSHEIRNPLGAVLGATEMLRMSALSEDQKEPLEILDVAGGMLRSMMDDVLELGRIDAGKFSLRKDRFQIATLADELVRLLELRARERRIALRATVEDPDALGDRLVGDADRLRQILVNIAGNSLKFTDAGFIHVQLSLVRSMDSGPVMLTMRVEDSGRGMDAQALSRMFQRFDQAGDQSRTSRMGSGLGLAIVRELVERMGGTIRAESTPRVGTTVTAVVPLTLDNKA